MVKIYCLGNNHIEDPVITGSTIAIIAENEYMLMLLIYFVRTGNCIRITVQPVYDLPDKTLITRRLIRIQTVCQSAI